MALFGGTFRRLHRWSNFAAPFPYSSSIRSFSSAILRHLHPPPHASNPADPAYSEQENPSSVHRFLFEGISRPSLNLLLRPDLDGYAAQVWADSVKRKRKVKMNKHKYQKRRKLDRNKA